MDFRVNGRRSDVFEVPLRDVKPFFSICPLCYAKDSTNIETENLRGGLVQKSYVSCKQCGARWLLLVDLFDYVKGAQLVIAGTDEKGADLFQVEHPVGFWQRLALLGLKEKEEKVIKEREVIVKEIVKIRCSYCHKLYDETFDKCPNCGASS